MPGYPGYQYVYINNSNSRNRVYTGLMLIAIVGYFLWLMIPHLKDNLWNDEIYTLKKFTFVHFHKTITDYHVPNNHVFYNLCDNAYLRLLGVTQLKTVLEKPEILRLPLLLLALLTLICTFQTARIIAGSKAGLLAATILVVSIGYQNFCLQVRGYAFSQLFDLVLILVVLSYLFNSKKIFLAVIAFSSFAAIYSVPSNLYPVLGVLAFLLTEIVVQKLTQGTLERPYVTTAIFIVAGILAAVLCYLPIARQVTNNEYVNGQTFYDKTTFPQLLLLATYQFVLDRHFLIFMLWCSSLVLCLAYMWHSTSRYVLLMKILFFQVITPLVLILIQGQHPPDRTFAYAAPILAICTGAGIVLVLVKFFPQRLGYSEIGYLSFCLIIGNQMQLRGLQAAMNNNAINGIRTQNLYYSYFSINFHPLAVTRYLKEHSDNGQIPVVLKDSEPHDLPDYFHAFELPYHPFDSLDYFLQINKTVYLVTRYPLQLDQDFKQKHNCSVKEMTETSYHHVMELEKLND